MACVTILKAFFHHGYELRVKDEKGNMVPFAFVANADGSCLVNEIEKYENKALTVEGELNNMCSNVSIGRNWAGVHYFTDYIESIRMGEEIALGVLEKQKMTFGENFSMSVRTSGDPTADPFRFPSKGSQAHHVNADRMCPMVIFNNGVQSRTMLA